MKPYIIKFSLLVPILVGLFATSSSAEVNPQPQVINELLTEAAIKYEVPPEIVKAVASVESNWRQFNDKGQPLISSDGGIGIMQITKNNLNQDELYKLKTNIQYNIEQGVIILRDNYNRKDLPKIKGADRKVIENWYFPVMAYNGTKPVNSPLVQKTGKRNTGAYQEKVFTEIEKNRGRALADYPFAKSDFVYNPNSTENIKFKKLTYALSNPINTSHTMVTSNSKVLVTGSNVKLREKPGTSSRVIKTIAKDTILTVTGGLEYESTKSSQNQFVWYPVKMSNGVKGYIASSYLSKYVLTAGNVTNKSTTVTGNSEKGYTITLKAGSKILGTIKSKTASGPYSFKIKVQPAGTKLRVIATDQAGVVHEIKDITVKDIIPPAMPSANTISDQSTSVSGKAEAGSTVTVKAGQKTWSGKVNAKGQYTIKIIKQKPGTKLTITAKDIANNVSSARTMTVLDKTAPSAPKVNAVTTKTKVVTGKAEANATVTIKVKNITLGSAKVNSKGSFKVTIKAQKKSTILSVTAKDKANNTSKATQIKIKK